MGETGQADGLSDAASRRAARGLAARRALNAFRRDERGATAVELGILVGLIAVVLVGVLTLMGDNLKTVFTKVSAGFGA